MTAQRLQQVFPFFWQSISNSYTQIFFSKDKVFGFILIAVSLFDLSAGISGLLAVVSANSFAFLIGLNRQKVINGLYGFNALLTGLGLGVAFQINAAFIVVIVFSALLSLLVSVLLDGWLYKYGLPYLSLPFLVAIWVVILSTRQFTQLEISERGIYVLNEMYLLGGLPMVKLYLWFDTLVLPIPVKTYLLSLGAIFFQYHLFVGLLIATGLIIWSRIAFIYSLIGFLAAWFFYGFTGVQMSEIGYSYIGFNYILTAIGIGTFFVVPSVFSLFWVIISVPLLAFFISSGSYMLASYQLSVYSLPFNVVMLLLLYIFRVRERFHNKPGLVLVQQSSPENNLYSHVVNLHRLAHLGKFPVHLPFFGTWKVTQGINGSHTHQEAWKYAWDFEMTDEDGKTYTNDGNKPEDYYCFGKPIVAPADGYITVVEDGVSDNNIGDMNLNNNWGNSVVIHHAEAFFSQMSHLGKGSILVKKGQYVRKGEQIASCGNSGRSPFPHLHFQFQTAGTIGASTLDYPFTAYLKQADEKLFFAAAQPQNNDLVSNNQIVELLDEALHFVPGQIVRFKQEDSLEPVETAWKVETDIYNNSYFLCQQTHAKAWFVRQPDLFYFTHFEGTKDCLLYDFYLAAYQLITGFSPGLVMCEAVTNALYPKPAMRLFQDFIAPFYMFLSIEYTLVQKKYFNNLTSSKILLQSQVSFKVLGKETHQRSYELEFENNRLELLNLSFNNKNTILKRV